MALIVSGGCSGPTRRERGVGRQRVDVDILILSFTIKYPLEHPGHGNNDRYAWGYTKADSVGEQGRKPVRLIPECSSTHPHPCFQFQRRFG